MQRIVSRSGSSYLPEVGSPELTFGVGSCFACLLVCGLVGFLLGCFGGQLAASG